MKYRIEYELKLPNIGGMDTRKSIVHIFEAVTDEDAIFQYKRLKEELIVDSILSGGDKTLGYFKQYKVNKLLRIDIEEVATQLA